jgi:hypothetical protein
LTPYERALQQLARAQPRDFLAERARLVTELRKSDAAAAAELRSRRKPTASVWAVDQLYWNAREAFDRLFAAAAPLRKGDLRSTDAYRKALADMRQRATAILESGGYEASDATLGRVDMTLAALAAAGGFGAEPPGALCGDLAPPGFDAMDAPARTERKAPSRLTLVRRPADAASEAARGAHPDHRRDEQAKEQARRREEQAHARNARAEERARAAEKARLRAKRKTLERQLASARKDVERCESLVAAHQERLDAAKEKLSGARAAAAKLERDIEELNL